jgi:predicted GH43/DUF377 family glycosyl hydrolase
LTAARDRAPAPGREPALERTPVVLTPDPRRVVARLFLPGQEATAPGTSRAAGVIERCLALGDQETRDLLADVLAQHGNRHRALPQILQDHFAAVAHRVEDRSRLAAQNRQLIGAFFTQEYALEAAALFNPSVVAHPQQDVPAGHLRFILSARAVGEGHLSSVVFRTGVLRPEGPPGPRVTIDPGSHYAGTGTPRTTLIDGARLRHEAGLAGVDAESLDFVLSDLPQHFTLHELGLALDRLSTQRLTRVHTHQTAQALRRLAEGWYEVEFAPTGDLSERTLMPQIQAESHGMEDARFVRFTDDDGSTTYLATYTAFDGEHIGVRQLRTDDFHTFRSSTLTGKAATNKGMALFPRRVAGRHLALSRWDRENITVASSADGHHWPHATAVATPVHPWELIQLGNCGSPIETPAGWLVLTHGVGPMRRYAIGAMLLDLNDPTRVIGQLRRPLLTPADDERNGYVPNVIYSCGTLLHEQTLLLPYGCSDSRIRIALLDLPTLLDHLTPPGAPGPTTTDHPSEAESPTFE